MSDRTVFRLHAHCIPVRGARRSTICDLQRLAYHLIPNGLYEILTAHRDHTRDEIAAAFAPGDAPVIDEYFGFLERNELGWWCDEPERFPPMDLSWDAPARITNAIVDVGAGSRHDFASLFAQLEALGCQAVEVRVFVPWTLLEMEEVVALADDGALRSLQVILPWQPGFTAEAILDVHRRHPRLLSVFVHAAPERRAVGIEGSPASVVFRPERVTSEAHCGFVSPAHLVVSLSAFTEALAHNSCLNRKLSVDQHGEIRNCPALPASFGNAATTPLAEALERPGFTDAWSITKDQVETCRDCEFRYICTDCRAIVRDPADARSKPARCGYDPYTATWSEALPVGAVAGRVSVPFDPGALDRGIVCEVVETVEAVVLEEAVA